METHYSQCPEHSSIVATSSKIERKQLENMETRRNLILSNEDAPIVDVQKDKRENLGANVVF